MKPLPPLAEQGAACTNCGATAIVCQRRFVASDDTEWCCGACRTQGPRALHIATEGSESS